MTLGYFKNDKKQIFIIRSKRDMEHLIEKIHTWQFAQEDLSQLQRHQSKQTQH